MNEYHACLTFHLAYLYEEAIRQEQGGGGDMKVEAKVRWVERSGIAALPLPLPCQSLLSTLRVSMQARRTGGSELDRTDIFTKQRKKGEDGISWWVMMRHHFSLGWTCPYCWAWGIWKISSKQKITFSKHYPLFPFSLSFLTAGPQPTGDVVQVNERDRIPGLSTE